MKKNILTPLESIIYGMVDENKKAAAVCQHSHATGVASEQAHWNLAEFRMKYAIPLRKYVTRSANDITKRHSHAWGVRVTVYPNHSGITKTVTPSIDIQWDGRHGRISLHCHAQTPEAVVKFLERFKQVVIACQHGEDNKSHIATVTNPK